MAEGTLRDELDSRLRSAGVDPEPAMRLAIFGALLLEANRRVNLTGAKDAEALAPHLMDALTLLPFVQFGSTLVDVGSGGGLPGIPLGIAAELRVTLIEPIAKKAAFLREALAALGLGGDVFAARAEVVARERLRGSFDVATARAVSSAPTVAELTLPLLRVGGRALLQRGAVDDRERRALEDAVPMLGGRIIEERVLTGDRRVFIVEQLSLSGERFPRRNGVPEKRPLCYG